VTPSTHLDRATCGRARPMAHRPVKPASTRSFQLLRAQVLEAPAAAGVIISCPAAAVGGDPVFAAPSSWAPLHRSTETFQRMWGTIAGNLAATRLPAHRGRDRRKDFVFAHPSADARALVVALVRGSFEYQGQKCSAASAPTCRPRSGSSRSRAACGDRPLRMGAPTTSATSCARHRRSVVRQDDGVRRARAQSPAPRSSRAQGRQVGGYFVEPTVVRTDDPRFRLMQEEIFAPCSRSSSTTTPARRALELCDTTSRTR